MRHDRWIKKGYGFKRIFSSEGRTDQQAANFGNRLLGFNVHLESFELPEPQFIAVRMLTAKFGTNASKFP